jgi:hypothetical protein
MANQLHGDNRTIRTPEKRLAFLQALAQTCNITRACEISGMGCASVYEWRNDDRDFAMDWKNALEVGADTLEDEAVRRAKDGVEKPVYQGGKLVGHIQEYSDTLLIFLLKGARPEKYRDRIQQELSGPSGQTIQLINCVPRPHREE